MNDKSSHEIFQFLQKWDSEYHTYNLMTFHSMEIYNELEKLPYLEEWWNIDLTKYFKDEFLSFSTEGGTGYFAFWHYPALQEGIPPIVLLPSGSSEPELSASNLNDLVSKMLHNIYFNSDWGGELNKTPNKEELEGIYYDLIDEYENEFDKEISLEKIQSLLKADRIEFKRRALEIVKLSSEEEIERNVKQHPSFVDRYKEFDNKSIELLPNEHPGDFVLTFELLPKVLDGFDILMKDGKNTSIIKQGIEDLKIKYPDLYNSELFQEWMKQKS